MRGGCLVTACLGLAALLTAAALLAAAGLTKSDEAFLKMAADANMTEAHMGKVAENQGAVAGVRDFGQTLVKDHTQAYDQLEELAQKVGAPIPNGIDIAKDRPDERLIHMSGAKFDHDFVRDEVSSHREAIGAFRREAEHGQNPEVRAYAKKMVPVLEKHLHIAERLLKTTARG